MELNPVRILSYEDMDDALVLGAQAQRQSEMMKLVDRKVYNGISPTQANQLGKMGEIVVKRLTGSSEPLTPGTFKNIPDVSGFEIKTSMGHGSPLLVRPSDVAKIPNQLVILVTTEHWFFRRGCVSLYDRRFIVRGYCVIRDVPTLCDGKMGGYGDLPPAWFVLQSKLRPIGEII